MKGMDDQLHGHQIKGHLGQQDKRQGDKIIFMLPLHFHAYLFRKIFFIRFPETKRTGVLIKAAYHLFVGRRGQQCGNNDREEGEEKDQHELLPLDHIGKKETLQDGDDHAHEGADGKPLAVVAPPVKLQHEGRGATAAEAHHDPSPDIVDAAYRESHQKTDDHQEEGDGVRAVDQLAVTCLRPQITLVDIFDKIARRGVDIGIEGGHGGGDHSDQDQAAHSLGDIEHDHCRHDPLGVDHPLKADQVQLGSPVGLQHLLDTFNHLGRIMLRSVDNAGDQRRPLFFGDVGKIVFYKISDLHLHLPGGEGVVHKIESQYGKADHQGPAEHHQEDPDCVGHSCLPLAAGTEIFGVGAIAQRADDQPQQVEDHEHHEVLVHLIPLRHVGMPLYGRAEPLFVAGDVLRELRELLCALHLPESHQRNKDGGEKDDPRLEDIGIDHTIEPRGDGVGRGDAHEDEGTDKRTEGQEHGEEQANPFHHVCDHADGEDDHSYGRDHAGELPSPAAPETELHPLGTGHHL